MKTYLPFVLFLLLCSNGVQAQNSDHKNRMSGIPDPLGHDNMHGLSTWANKNETNHPSVPLTPARNHLKTAMEEIGLLDSTVVDYLDPHANGGGSDTTKTIYAYDASGNMTLNIIYSWLGNQYGTPGYWEQEFFEGFSYNAGGNLTSDSLYDCDGSPEECFYFSKTDYSYNEDGNVISSSSYNWDYNTNQWAKSDYKRVFTYDASGHLTELLVSDTSQLHNGYKEEYVYDNSEFENLIKVNHFNWDNDSSKLILNGWDDITYDDNGNVTMILYYYYDSVLDQSSIWAKAETVYDANGKITTVFSERDSTSKWYTYNKQTDYYSQHNITDVHSIHERKITVYPNPASGYIHFDGLNVSGSATVELFNMEGKMVLEQKLAENRQISVSSLTKGLYMYKLNNSGNLFTGKLLIE